jgi:hypothetical protein
LRTAENPRNTTPAIYPTPDHSYRREGKRREEKKREEKRNVNNII